MANLVARTLAHWPLKLASLALAVLLWALVSAEQVTMHWISVPVEAEVRDPRYVLTDGPGPGEVQVLFAGPGRLLWQLALDRPTLVLPVRDVDRSGYLLEADMIRFPEGVRSVAVRDIRPSVVRLDVQRVATRDVPVRPRFTRGSLSRWTLQGTPEVMPAEVRVTGPAEDLARLRSLETVPIELTSTDSLGFDLQAAVDTAGLREFILSPLSVRVRGDLDARVQRTLAVPMVDAGGASAGLAELRLTGPARLVRDLDTARIRVELGDEPRIVGVPAAVQATTTGRRAAAPDTAAAAP